MYKENDIELLLNYEFTIEEVKSKIDSNIIKFRFVFIYLLQKLINILEIFKNDNNKINEYNLKLACSTMKRLKELSIIYKHKNEFNQEKINQLIENLILICKIFEKKNQYQKDINLFYSELILKLLFKIHPEESAYFIHFNINLKYH